jgi:hypothetical protein
MEKERGLPKELLEILEESKEARAIAFLSFIERAMKKLGLTWIDISSQLIGENCLICGSRIRTCLNCKQVVSVGTRKCLHCGFSLEKVEIEPSLR